MVNPDSPNAPKQLLSEPYLNRGIIALICLEIGLAIAYLSTSLKYGYSPDLIDFNGFRSLPSLIQAFQLFLIGTIALILLIAHRQIHHRLSCSLLTFIALLSFFGGLDEVLKIHLSLNQYNWKGIYFGILVAIPIICRRDLLMLWRSHRDVVLWIAVGISIFLIGGFGAELLKSGSTPVFLDEKTGAMMWRFERLFTTVEELAELLGETLTLYGIGRFLTQLQR